MQTYPHDPAAQHLPAGWPLAQQPVMVAPGVAPQPVVGGGATTWDSTTRVRWGRILLVFLAVALGGFGIWNAIGAAGSDGKSGTTPGARNAGGGLVDSPKLDATDEARQARVPSTPKVAAATTPSRDARAARTAPRRRAAARRSTVRKPARRAAGGGAGTTATRPVRAQAAPHRSVAAAGPKVGVHAAGGGEGNAALPYTGAETWIAAILGVLILTCGVLLQVHAVRIGMTALLYRRGILLRPVDCARLAGERGIPAVRVWLSGVLHRLLAEPRRNDFVSVH